jgi:hypothetical protein
MNQADRFALTLQPAAYSGRSSDPRFAQADERTSLELQAWYTIFYFVFLLTVTERNCSGQENV